MKTKRDRIAVAALQRTARRECATMLRDCRLDAGMTQARVAKSMKTTQSTIARLESGENNTTLRMMVEFVDACDCHLDVEARPDVGTFAFVVKRGLRGV